MLDAVIILLAVMVGGYLAFSRRLAGSSSWKAMVLPLLLSIAAVGSQFSAAVADNSGAGGLLEDVTRRRLPIRYAYLFVLGIPSG